MYVDASRSIEMKEGWFLAVRDWATVRSSCFAGYSEITERFHAGLPCG